MIINFFFNNNNYYINIKLQLNIWKKERRVNDKVRWRVGIRINVWYCVVVDSESTKFTY